MTENLLEADMLDAVSRQAEECGFESVVVRADLNSQAFLVSLAAANKTSRKIKFLLQCNTKLVPKRNLLQQVNTLTGLQAGRVAIYLPIDQDGNPFCAEGASPEEYDSSVRDFLHECSTLPEPRPEIFVEGDSAEAAELAIKFADCLWLKPKRPEQLYSDALPVLHMGKEVGLRALLIARETAEEARAIAAELLPSGECKDTESCIWTGAPSLQYQDGLAMAGSYVEVAEALMRYKANGVSQFLFSGPPDQQLAHFAAGILPAVRRLEANGSRGEVAG